MRIKEYVVVQRNNWADFYLKINELLAKGWIPQGGVSCFTRLVEIPGAQLEKCLSRHLAEIGVPPQKKETFFMQAMVLPGDTNWRD